MHALYDTCPACKNTGIINHGVDGLSFCNCPFGIANSQNKSLDETLVLKEQMLKSLLCMYIELPETVADNIKKNVLNYVNALEKHISKLKETNAIVFPSCNDVFKYLETVPIPPTEILLSGVTNYYAKHVYDYIKQKLGL